MADNTNNKRRIVICGKGGGISTVTWDDIQDKPEFATVATTGDYDDLTDKPTIPAAPVQSDWNEADNTSLAYIANKPSIPTVPTDVSAFNNDAGYLDSTDLKDELVDTYNFFYEDPDTGDLTPNWVDFSSMNDELYNYGILDIDAGTGDYVYQPDYNDLQNKPSIPAAQVNADWNANSGVAQILNKPTIPSVPAMATETLTFTLQGGTTKTIDFYTVPNYFYVEDISGSDNTLSITGSNSNPIEIFKSTDRLNWTSMGTTGSTAITATIPANSKLYIKATTTKYDGTYFRATGNHNVGGNSMSLLYGDNFDGKTTLPNSTFTFTGLFSGDTHLVNADKLELPATIITGYGYRNMFNGCTSLITAPVLPATTLGSDCYSSMFKDCTSLVTAPVLPATNNISSQCYNGMFNGCTSLNRMVVYATNQSLTTFCISNWLNNVAATGDFYNLGGITYPTDSESGIPAGWTEHTSL